MKLFAPVYYKDFSCIADKCKHSCCIGWEIDVDGASLEKYKTVSAAYGKNIRESIEYGDTPHFILDEDERCPHLDRDGLCRIITHLGEDHLCHICREHPRFYNRTERGLEVGIGMACEEACRIILSSNEYNRIMEIGDAIEADDLEEDTDFDPVSQRDKLLEILSDRGLDYKTRLDLIYDVYGVSPFEITDPDWQKCFSALEYLDPSHKTLFSDYKGAPCLNEEPCLLLERFLGYLIFRHCTGACDENDFRMTLGFCLVSERMLSFVYKKLGEDGFESFSELSRIFSEEIEYSEDNTESIKMQFI